MKILQIKGMVVALLLTVAMVLSATVADAAIRYTADGGDRYVLDYNHKTNKGKYAVLNDYGSLQYAFDYNSSTQEFTMYDADENLFAVRKFQGRDTLVCKEYVNDFPNGIYEKRSDGCYYYYTGEYRIYEYMPKAFLLFLDNDKI